MALEAGYQDQVTVYECCDVKPNLQQFSDLAVACFQVDLATASARQAATQLRARASGSCTVRRKQSGDCLFSAALDTLLRCVSCLGKPA